MILKTQFDIKPFKVSMNKKKLDIFNIYDNFFVLSLTEL